MELYILKFQTAEYIIHLQAMHWTMECHFEATKQLIWKLQNIHYSSYEISWKKLPL
jgi:hypothetical protein